MVGTGFKFTGGQNTEVLNVVMTSDLEPQTMLTKHGRVHGKGRLRTKCSKHHFKKLRHLKTFFLSEQKYLFYVEKDSMCHIY